MGRGLDGAWRQDSGHGLGCFELRRPWRGVTLHMFGYGCSPDATL